MCFYSFTNVISDSIFWFPNTIIRPILDKSKLKYCRTPPNKDDPVNKDSTSLNLP